MFAGLAALLSVLIVPSILSVAAASTTFSNSQTVYSWGDFGEDGPVSPIVTSPTIISGIPGTITQISATNSATYALTSAGTVWAFGANDFGELGNGTTINSFSTPVQVQFPSGVTIASLPSPMPYATAMAIDTTGKIWGWGINQYGELCLGSASQKHAPVQLPFSTVSLATGAGGHATYDAGGRLYSCGYNVGGALGNGTTTNSMTPVKVVESGLTTKSVTGLYSGYGETGALLSDDTFWDWGLNNHGQLGDGSTTNRDVPVHVLFGASVSKVVMGGNTANDGQTLVILSTGKVKGWGSDQFGQLCTGSTANAVTTPIRIRPATGVTWVSVYSGGGTSYAVDSSQNLWACGANANGEVGNGTTVSPQLNPVEVLSGVTAFSSTSRNEAAITN